jgi:hypothetical protein
LQAVMLSKYDRDSEKSEENINLVAKIDIYLVGVTLKSIQVYRDGIEKKSGFSIEVFDRVVVTRRSDWSKGLNDKQRIFC